MNSFAEIQRTDPAPKNATIFFGSSKTANLFIQPKLTIKQPNDPYEQEADAMADKVMRMEQPGIQLKPLPVSTIQRKCEHCEKEEKKMQRKEINGNETVADSSLENYVGSLSSGGQPLSTEARNFYEPRFGYDFSNVKIHTDTVAAKSAQSINALAYTSGNNIVFNSGQFSPNTDSGKKLLGHELTHVIQQASESVQTKRIQRACSPAELAALNITMHSFCDLPRSCNMQTDTCATATAKVAAGYGCTGFRTLIQMNCFRPGDPGYETHMEQLAQAYAALRNCQVVMSVKCAAEEAAAAAEAEAEAAAAAEAEAEAEAAEAAETAEAIEAVEAAEVVEEGLTFWEILEGAAILLAL